MGNFPRKKKRNQALNEPAVKNSLFY